MIVLLECETCDCVWTAVCVLQGSRVREHRVFSQCESPQRQGVLGGSIASLLPLAVPGKARLATAGAKFSVQEETK